MTKPICATAALLTICFAIVLADGPLQNQPVRVGRLDPRIGPAKRELYKSILDAQEWRNPYLVIRREGIEVVAQSLASGRTVSVQELGRTLIELPVTAWPYGTVVGVVEISIREADGSDEQPINDNRRATLAILKALKVTVERWPSS